MYIWVLSDGENPEKKEWEGRTEKRLVCVGGNMSSFQLNCIWNPMWERESMPSANVAPSASSTWERSESVISTARERALGLYRRWCLLRITEPVNGARAETALSPQALQHFKLNDDDYTPSTSPMSEWCFCHSKTLSREMLLISSSPKGCRAISLKSRADSKWVSDFCQSCTFATTEVKGFTLATGAFL